jgi:hypothetical protein
VAWEKRRNGRRYFYLCQRTPDGRVQKKYFGKGLRAKIESIRLETKARDRRRDAQLKAVLDELESIAADYASSIRLLFESQLYAAGYHNPKSRGWRKRRNSPMIKSMECENSEQKVTEPEPGEWVSEKVTLEEVVGRCRNGDRDALVTLRRVMQEHPNLFDRHGHVGAKIQAEWIRALSGHDLFEREVMLKTTRELRLGLIEEGSGSHLERLLVDQVVATNLEQGFHQLLEARCVGKGSELPKFQVDASLRASRRHEKSLVALTTIRTLTPKMTAQTELVIEKAAEDKTQEKPTWQTPLLNNRISAVFDRTLHPAPMN